MHDALRTALQRKIEDLAWGGPTLAPVMAAWRTHTDPALLALHEAQMLASPAASALATADPAFPSPAEMRAASGNPDSLAAAVLAVRLGVGPGTESVGPGATRRIEEATTQAWQTIWPAVLGVATDPRADWLLPGFVAAQSAHPEALLWIAILFARVGFVTPEAALPVYDAVAAGWCAGKASRPLLGIDWRPLLSRPVADVRAALGIVLPGKIAEAADAPQLLATPGRLPAGLPPLLWEVVGTQVDPGTITPRIASFGMTYDASLKDACARAILRFAGQEEVARQPWPPRVAIESLAGYQPGTLGHAYYHLIVDNGFDPEVLDPDTVTGFHPGLDGTNRRILQTHEIWHLVAGYSTSPLHETAISAFQLAQFGHNYSAIFLATITLLLWNTLPPFLDPTLQVIFEGWQHGRETRPLMTIDWFALWSQPIPELRRDLRITPFRSIVPDIGA